MPQEKEGVKVAVVPVLVPVPVPVLVQGAPHPPANGLSSKDFHESGPTVGIGGRANRILSASSRLNIFVQSLFVVAPSAVQ
ncbi:uncharacterized protein BO95DRAFT_440627 [Aspergillus brunneoviolaceus CBS 621.78]|uniref:Uncharacterized protein n=1 Tax=Aspergillus brunneoviolaceus CBS 621.78 TaxID=1450534 RepID=A0ACD1GGP7_9EURO|nr:hypothetical protein BO95DRAFT_440627 [Aspergillus brunneoviolaceus CBS 621.78]RAH48289.1 hypothetical protein BO95DRAFT_440627 [Aspergillus brunneoviolaceus CBS 621.78]